MNIFESLWFALGWTVYVTFWVAIFATVIIITVKRVKEWRKESFEKRNN